MRSHRPAHLAARAASLLLVLGLVAPALAQARAGRRILVTNDDGWSSPGLAAVVVQLSRLGEVVVSAPAENRSGSSQSVGSLGRPFEVKKIEIPSAKEAWSVDGSPADSATFGVLGLGKDHPFDLVVSGINRGANVGTVSHLSGTVGAAMQAAMLGVRAIAVSQDSLSEDYAVAALYTRKLAEQALEHDLPVGLVLSINVPEAATRAGASAVAAPMGGTYLDLIGFTKVSGDDQSGMWRVTPKLVSSSAGLEGTDTGAYLDGKITVTPLLFDWTAHEKIDWLRGFLPQP